MNTNVYTIYDKVAEESGPLFQAINHGVARRSFLKVITEADPATREDYQLIHVGEFDTMTSILTPREPEQVVSTQVRDFVADAEKEGESA